MTPWTATVAKLATDDGLWKIQTAGTWKIGQEVEIDFDSRKVQKFVHQPTGQTFDCEVVATIKPIPGEPERYIPIELLDL